MSRGQSTQAFNTASSENAADFGNSQSAFGNTESSIDNYNNALAKFVASNPYTAGGEYDKTVNTGLANISDAGSNSLKGALQSQALRTGQNSAADAATAASAAQQNTRDLSNAMATAQQNRIGAEAGYNQTALGATATPISANQSLYSTSLGGANSALGTAEGAAQTPSFWDEVGGGLAAGLGKGLSGGGVSVCWVAASLYGGWDDPRVHLLRWWIFGPFSQTWSGYLFAEVYRRTGKHAAAAMERSPLLRAAFKRLFDRLLAQAQRAIGK